MRAPEQVMAASSHESIGGCPGERLLNSHVPRWLPTSRRPAPAFRQLR